MPSIEVKGKPTLFFSGNHQDQTWRLKEKIVAVIESGLQHTDDLYTFSTKRIKNIVGDSEEVDVAFANIGDPASIFNFVQVRDREITEGRPWVQQLLGQHSSLGINRGTLVSTTRFSRPAKRLALKHNIPLRLLLANTDDNIKRWYRPSIIHFESPIINILHCHIGIILDDKYLWLKSNENKSLEDNLLITTNKECSYKVVSLKRVFNVDVMSNNAKLEELLSQIPINSSFHGALARVQYEKPRLYISLNDVHSISSGNIKGIFPIMSIKFFLEVNRSFINAPISYKFKYVNAISNECIAQSIVSELLLNEQQHYVSLVRYTIADKFDTRIVGAVFQ